jgi:hypothetical protein
VTYLVKKSVARKYVPLCDKGRRYSIEEDGMKVKTLVMQEQKSGRSQLLCSGLLDQYSAFIQGFGDLVLNGSF